MKAYTLMFLAIVAEIIGTSALKASHGFTKLYPTLIVCGGYFFAFWLMSLALKHLPVGVVYALWSGLGIVGITLIGVFYFKEVFGLWHLVGTLCILFGVLILSFVTQTE